MPKRTPPRRPRNDHDRTSVYSFCDPGPAEFSRIIDRNNALVELAAVLASAAGGAAQ